MSDLSRRFRISRPVAETILAISVLAAVLAPRSTPAVPPPPDPVTEAWSHQFAPPGTPPESAIKPNTAPFSTESAPSLNAGVMPPLDLNLPLPETPVDLHAADRFTQSLRFEIHSTPTDWANRLADPHFGRLIVAPLQSALTHPVGASLVWRRSPLGAPEVLLEAEIHLPAASDGPAPSGTVASSKVRFRQWLSFYPDADGSWTAAASPFYAIAQQPDGAWFTLLSIQAGTGAWRSRVGPAGLLIRGFLEGALAASRDALTHRFGPNALARSLAHNRDLIFLCRAPQR